ncbi:MAG: hypothetical protein M1821_001797 [Bathelium mastoideum]|nr:MAG: hypothetical protein M1821_001797 [Bathelium mastoideum]
MVGYRYAFSLPKEELRNATPPGTDRLVDHALERTKSGREAGEDKIVLVPRPSADPADPLNWPRWRKLAILGCMSLYSFSVNFASASLSSAIPFMIMAFPPKPTSEPDLTHLLAVNVLFQGAANLWWVPLANIFGRRTINLIALLIFALCSVWCAEAKTYTSLLVGRIFQGIGMAPADCVAPDVVGEIFFVHQRGRGMAIYTLFLAQGSLVGALTGSYIAAAHGWRWTQWINTILAGAVFVLCFFFQPETLYGRRQWTSDYSTTARTGSVPQTEDIVLQDEKDQVAKVEETTGDSRANYAPFTFSRSLSIGVYRGNVLQKFAGPILALRFPGTWLVMLQYGGLVGGIVTISAIGPQLVAGPPYFWGQNAGAIVSGGLIGTALGAIYAYFIADWSIKRQAAKNARGGGRGLAEPESRLLTMLPSLFVATTGLWVFGFSAQYPGGTRWVGLQFGLGMLSFGLMQVPSLGFNYIIEAYNAVSGDCFVMITTLRAVISFAWTFFVGTWVQERGPAEPFGIFGMLLGIFSLLTIPMWYYGKRTRIATAKWLPAEADH